MGWLTQDSNEDASVRVKAGYSQDNDSATTEIIVAERDGSGHHHIVYDDRGTEIHNEWIPSR